jgi:hypothetical protein
MNQVSPRIRLAGLVAARVGEIADESAARVFTEVESYRDNTAAGLREQVAAHCRAIFEIFARDLAGDGTPTAHDFTATAGYAIDRVTQSIPLADFLRAFRISQITLWESLQTIVADDPDLREPAGDAVGVLMQVLEEGATAAAAGYAEAERYLVANTARATRDLVEDLLGGKAPVTGIGHNALNATGLDAHARIAVFSARPVAPPRNPNAFAQALGRIAAANRTGLLTMRHEEIIGIYPVAAGIEALMENLRRMGEVMATAGGLTLTAGLSTAHDGLDAVPEAYAEAGIARDSLHGAPGLRPLQELSALDYLLLSRDPTAGRLIDGPVRRFVEEDAAADGVYIETLLAYVGANLNAKSAAERLYVHSNTAYYRIDRIATRTGLDMRNFSDVLDLLVAVRLIAPHLAVEE